MRDREVTALIISAPAALVLYAIARRRRHAAAESSASPGGSRPSLRMKRAIESIVVMRSAAAEFHRLVEYEGSTEELLLQTFDKFSPADGLLSEEQFRSELAQRHSRHRQSESQGK